MKTLPPFPEVPANERTPCVDALLKIIEGLRETVQRQGVEIGRLKDEIAILKGEKARPQFKPSRMEPEACAAPAPESDPATDSDSPPKRPGSAKRSKTAEMTQPLLREMLGECGIDISAGQIDALLAHGHEGFLQVLTPVEN